jgi:hypothetical protein
VGTPRIQTTVIKHHDKTIDVLKFLKQATDGSCMLLKPNSNVPFDLADYPYDSIKDGDKLKCVVFVPEAV